MLQQYKCTQKTCPISRNHVHSKTCVISIIGLCRNHTCLCNTKTHNTNIVSPISRHAQIKLCALLATAFIGTLLLVGFMHTTVYSSFISVFWIKEGHQHSAFSLAFSCHSRRTSGPDVSNPISQEQGCELKVDNQWESFRVGVDHFRHPLALWYHVPSELKVMSTCQSDTLACTPNSIVLPQSFMQTLQWSPIALTSLLVCPISDVMIGRGGNNSQCSNHQEKQ